MSTHFVTFETTRGPITAELFDRDCPATVEHIERLVHYGFYVETRVHRVEPGALVHAGDPLTRQLEIEDPREGSGSSEQVAPSEVIGNRNRPGAGAVVMVPNGDGTSGSRFALVLDDAHAPSLQSTHTVFARVTDGMQVALSLKPGDAILAGRIWA